MRSSGVCVSEPGLSLLQLDAQFSLPAKSSAPYELPPQAASGSSELVPPYIGGWGTVVLVVPGIDVEFKVQMEWRVRCFGLGFLDAEGGSFPTMDLHPQ